MPSNYYFDDDEDGLSAQTSHPRFREVATDDFFYDCTDDFSPFGNDDGADTLAALEAWLEEENSPDEIPSFLRNLLDEWDFGVPKAIIQGSEPDREAWLAQEQMHETYLLSECHARVAAAFGQLKITGAIHPEIKDEALQAITCMLWLNDRSRKSRPDWPHADEERMKLAVLQAALSHCD